MPIVKKNEETGEDETFFTQDDMNAKEAERANLEKEKGTLSEELAKKEQVLREKSQNIDQLRKLKDMSEDEKAQMTQSELENRKMIENLQDTLEKTQQQLTDKEQKEISRERDILIGALVGDDEKLKTAFLEEYKLVNIEEKDADSVRLRVNKTARLLGIQTNEEYVSPLQQYWDGDAPKQKPDSEQAKKDEFFKEGKGKVVMDFLDEGNGTKKEEEKK